MDSAAGWFLQRRWGGFGSFLLRRRRGFGGGNGARLGFGGGGGEVREADARGAVADRGIKADWWAFL